MFHKEDYTDDVDVILDGVYNERTGINILKKPIKGITKMLCEYYNGDNRTVVDCMAKLEIPAGATTVRPYSSQVSVTNSVSIDHYAYTNKANIEEVKILDGHKKYPDLVGKYPDSMYYITKTGDKLLCEIFTGNKIERELTGTNGRRLSNFSGDKLFWNSNYREECYYDHKGIRFNKFFDIPKGYE